ncbi:hypothetical protein QBC46DRAFT_429830 [Diplogelasinospora grovesii]|uniref:Uncharacterized protein n=1 Tax=Diplogelasinospora grovesii TaxID=303347 RepID=A0AAN6MX74_9PEZI|nr:hypothetical protein QBC46DRAFT_429830 [Diplogelasinospora grovesii]
MTPSLSPTTPTRWSSIVMTVTKQRQSLHHRGLLDALTTATPWHGFLALVTAFVGQLLIAPIQYGLETLGVDFPASILALTVVFVVISLLGHLFSGVEQFYQEHLKSAADLLNRHMSIGFTIPLVMNLRNALPSGQIIGLITACFVVTPILTQTRLARLGHWLKRNPMVLFCWLLTIVIGLPLRYATGNDVVLATCLLFATWFSLLEIQVLIKSSKWLGVRRRSVLSGIFNAVLWTSLVMMAYVYLETAISQRSLPAMLDTLQTNTTLSTFILQKAASRQKQPSIAAGDIALSFLNSGLVAWGLKLYEYRRQLLSRAGVTVIVVSAVMALGNVILGPALTHQMGLSPDSRALAFAARSVTLALGTPVMKTLQGDAGLNAAMVVVSGIVFQMGLGFGVGTFLEKQVMDRIYKVWTEGLPRKPVAVPVVIPPKNEKPVGDLEAQQTEALVTPSARGGDKTNDPQTVAAGVTVGINSAAMGTAYLYETKSEAAPYSALSMMAIGIMTVVLTAIQPLARWIVEEIARS